MLLKSELRCAGHEQHSGHIGEVTDHGLHSGHVAEVIDHGLHSGHVAEVRATLVRAFVAFRPCSLNQSYDGQDTNSNSMISSYLRKATAGYHDRVAPKKFYKDYLKSLYGVV